MEEKYKSPAKLTKEEKDKVVDWLKGRREGPMSIICSVCGQQNWNIGAHLVAPVIFRQGGFVFGGSAYPTVMLYCDHCGNTLYLNAVKIGLAPQKKIIDAGKEPSVEGGSNA